MESHASSGSKGLGIIFKLLGLVVLPTIGILCLAYLIYAEKSYLQGEAARARNLIEFSVFASNLVHELQKERGASAGFLGSKGVKFKDTLPAQRQETDQKLENFNRFLNSGEFLIDDQSFMLMLKEVQAQLEQMTSVRERIWDLSASVAEAVGYYTSLNTKMLNMISELQKVDFKVVFTNQISAYVNFLMSKERAGIERAVMTGTFAVGQFAPGNFEKFIRLVTEQNTYLNSFFAICTKEQRDFYDFKASHESFALVNEMRTLAKEKAATGDFGVDAAHWFQTITSKINQLKEVEDSIGTDLKNLAVRLDSEIAGELRFDLGLSLVIILLSLLVSFFMARSLAQALNRTVGSLRDLTENWDLTKRFARDRDDEIGEVAASCNTMVEKLYSTVDSLSGNTKTLNVASQELASTSQEMSTQADQMSSATQTVAAAVEEMSASLNEVSQNITQASNVAHDASTKASDAAQLVDKLNTSADQIGKVVDTIKDIADQTNLLALNATIEAASAGDAGKGFAVVANEVKELARQTAQATVEIATQIKDIQTGTSSTVDSIQGIAKINAQLNEISTNVATAVQEQTATINEIASNVSNNARLAQSTKSGAMKNHESSGKLSEMVVSLTNIVKQFKT